MSNTETLKVFTVEWTASNDDLTELKSGTTEVEGYTEDAIDRALVFYILRLERKGFQFHKQHVSTRLATEAEVADREARIERDRLNHLLSN
jgi:hypothetical protein